MIITEFCNRIKMDAVKPANFEILATDISTNALETARLGAYDSLSMTRGMTDLYRKSYFRQNQSNAVVDPNLNDPGRGTSRRGRD